MIALLLSVLLSADCAKDDDCAVTTWQCCSCPKQHAVSKAELKRQEDECADVKCQSRHDCPPEKEDPKAVAVCKAGVCTLAAASTAAAPAPGAECKTALDCQVWCCPADLASFPKNKRPDKGCKRCPAPAPASECLDGKCAVAPHALNK